MANIKNGYPITETNQNGTQITTVYYSTNPDELSGMAAGMTDNRFIRVSQRCENGIYELETVEQVNTDGEAAEKPNKNYGAKTATLYGTVLSMPLEQHPKYRMNWNHYLFCKDSQSKPSFWYTAKDSSLSSSDKDKYKWGNQISEKPEGWYVIDPTKHANHYEIPTYVLQETARYRSFQAAAVAIGDKVGRIVSPTAKITVKSGRDWRCDEGRIQYDGKHWIGTLSYTLSGEGGWDKDLYS